MSYADVTTRSAGSFPALTLERVRGLVAIAKQLRATIPNADRAGQEWLAELVAWCGTQKPKRQHIRGGQPLRGLQLCARCYAHATLLQAADLGDDRDSDIAFQWMLERLQVIAENSAEPCRYCSQWLLFGGLIVADMQTEQSVSDYLEERRP